MTIAREIVLASTLLKTYLLPSLHISGNSGCIQIFQGPHRRILQLAGGVKLNKPNFAAV